MFSYIFGKIIGIIEGIIFTIMGGFAAIGVLYSVKLMDELEAGTKSDEEVLRTAVKQGEEDGRRIINRKRRKKERNDLN